VQDTFLRECEARGEAAVIRNPRTWRRQVVRNCVITRWRTDARHGEIIGPLVDPDSVPGGTDPFSEVEREDVAEVVRAAVARLPDRLARVVALRMMGLTREEIAKRLGCAVPTVYQRWRLARELLSVELAGVNPEA
jgi:RNA polymerase sigma factor (sigma-70 family)